MNPNDFGKKYLVEQCQKIKVVDYIRKAKSELKEVLIDSYLEADEYDVFLNTTKTGFGGTRYWFSCPLCHKRSGVLYKHPVSQILGCRECLNLDYRKHRYNKMVDCLL
jgi:hypothetical protein